MDFPVNDRSPSLDILRRVSPSVDSVNRRLWSTSACVAWPGVALQTGIGPPDGNSGNQTDVDNGLDIQVKATGTPTLQIGEPSTAEALCNRTMVQQAARDSIAATRSRRRQSGRKQKGSSAHGSRRQYKTSVVDTAHDPYVSIGNLCPDPLRPSTSTEAHSSLSLSGPPFVLAFLRGEFLLAKPGRRCPWVGNQRRKRSNNGPATGRQGCLVGRSFARSCSDSLLAERFGCGLPPQTHACLEATKKGRQVARGGVSVAGMATVPLSEWSDPLWPTSDSPEEMASLP